GLLGDLVSTTSSHCDDPHGCHGAGFTGARVPSIWQRAAPPAGVALAAAVQLSHRSVLLPEAIRSPRIDLQDQSVRDRGRAESVSGDAPARLLRRFEARDENPARSRRPFDPAADPPFSLYPQKVHPGDEP